MKKPDKNKFKSVCEKKGGNMTEIAKSFDVERSTIWRWIKEDEEFKHIYDSVMEGLIDLTESQLMNLVKGVPKMEGDKFVGWTEKPDTTAILFYLKTKGKKRGYIEKTEVDAEINGSLIITGMTIKP